MAVLIPGKVLFLAEPYSASRSVRDALLSAGGHEIGWHHATLQELRASGHEIVEPAFSILRHPCEWLVSHYRHMTSWHTKGFDAFVEDFITNNESVYRHARSCETLLSFDRLTDDFQRMRVEYEIPSCTLPHVGVTPGRTQWRQIFSSRANEMVSNSLTRDFSLYSARLHSIANNQS